MLSEQCSILFNDAMSESITNRLTSNSMNLRTAHKYSSNEVQRICDQCSAEEERVNNKLSKLNPITQKAEYQALLSELKDLKDERDNEVEKIENQMSYKETDIQLENETLQVQLEALKAQTESFKEMLNQNIKKQFGYFQ